MLQYQLVSEGAVFDTVAISVKLYTTKKRSWVGCKKLGETTVSFETTVVVCGSCMEVSFVAKP